MADEPALNSETILNPDNALSAIPGAITQLQSATGRLQQSTIDLFRQLPSQADIASRIQSGIGQMPSIPGMNPLSAIPTNFPAIPGVNELTSFMKEGINTEDIAATLNEAKAELQGVTSLVGGEAVLPNLPINKMPPAVLDTTIQPSTNTQTVGQFIKNPLHSYATYTYNISLHALSAKEFNDMVDNPSSYTPRNVLISGAGRSDAQKYNRNENWKEDFYFQNLKIDGVIGLNALTKGSNALKIDFSIFEPNGFSFIERMMATADQLQWKSYLDVPYLIQIEFFGYDDKDLVPKQLPNLTKKIPIKFLDVKMNFSNKGAEYQCATVAYHHTIMAQSMISIPVHMNISSKNTLEEYFGSEKQEEAVQSIKEGSAKAREESIQKRWEELKHQASVDSAEHTPAPIPVTVAADSFKDATFIPKEININGLAAGLNAWQNRLVETKQKQRASTFTFKFDPEIGKSKVVFVQAKDPKNTAMRDKGTVQIEGSNAIVLKEGSSDIIQFNGGTSILTIINDIIKNSEYIHKQIKTLKDSASQTKTESSEQIEETPDPLSFFKITVSAKFKLDATMAQWDKTVEKYAYDITFYIRPYKSYGVRLPAMKNQGIPTIKDCVKNYNYYYTGKNDDILDLKIEFNNMWNTIMSVSPSKFEKEGNSLEEKNTIISPNAESTESTQSLMVNPIQLTSTTIDGVSLTQRDANSVIANNLWDNIYSRSAADMLKIDLEILGDPHYIQQDEIFYVDGSKRSVSKLDPRLLEDGSSLSFNSADLLINVTFRKPIDIDDTTGTFSFVQPKRLQKYSANSMFSGIYKVLTFETHFEAGIFKQKLQLVRIWNDTKKIKNPNAQRDVGFRGTFNPTLPSMPAIPSIPGLKDLPSMPKLPGTEALSGLANSIETTVSQQLEQFSDIRNQAESTLKDIENRVQDTLSGDAASALRRTENAIQDKLNAADLVKNFQSLSPEKIIDSSRLNPTELSNLINKGLGA